jgi:prepilin-type N-terminal cleavage/methylation domain-containing protein
MRSRSYHRGFSLLELLVAASLMASIVTAATMVLRSTQTSWTMHTADQQNLDAAYATLRHVTRGVRQAESVTAISTAGDLSGSLTCLLSSGQSVIWDHSGTQVNYGVTTPSSLLASGVSELSFVGYKADGVTTTTVPADVQSVVCTVKVPLQRTSSPTRTLSSRVWLRAW